jgi:hypothetical protein
MIEKPNGVRWTLVQVPHIFGSLHIDFPQSWVPFWLDSMREQSTEYEDVVQALQSLRISTTDIRSK